jgi:hypothetical protein
MLSPNSQSRLNIPKLEAVGSSGNLSSPHEGALMVSPHPTRRPSISCGFEKNVSQDVQMIGASGEIVVDGVTPDADSTSSVIMEAALSLKRTGAGAPTRMPRAGPRRCATTPLSTTSDLADNREIEVSPRREQAAASS